MPADAGYWVERTFAGKTQTSGAFADVFAIDARPPIHAGSRASSAQTEAFRQMLNEPEHSVELPPPSPLAGFVNLEQDDTAPAGVAIIRRFACQRGEIFIGLPVVSTAE